MSYTNQVPISLALDIVSGVYNNGLGYNNDHYASSSGVYDSSSEGCTTTGMIPYTIKSDGTYPTIYTKGLEFTASLYQERLITYNVKSDGTIGITHAGIGSNGTITDFFDIVELDTNYYKIEPKDGYYEKMAANGVTSSYARLSFKGSGEGLIVTLDEPIVDSEPVIIATGQITLSSVIDVKATYRYYLLQSSTLTTPSKPTAYPPSSVWNDTEPTYTEGSTNSLYTVDCTVFSDGTYSYSEVSLSTAYEAAKLAYNKAVNLDKALDQEGVLNRLTNGGTDEGVYLEDGKLYISASIIKSGSLLADLIKAGVIKSKDGTSVVIDLDEGTVDLTGNIETRKTLVSGSLYIQSRVDGSGLYAETYELVNNEWVQLGFTKITNGMVAMEDSLGDGTYYGINEMSLGNSDGTRVSVSITPSGNSTPNAQMVLNANNDTASNPLMLASTPTRNYITGLSDPEYPLWAANKRYVDNRLRRCVAGQSGSTTTNPWYKVASLSLLGSNMDYSAIFLVDLPFTSYKRVGILKARVRANSDGSVSNCGLEWLCATTDIPLSDFVLAYSSDASATVELWVRVAATYSVYHFTLLREGTRNDHGNPWTLYNTVSAGYASAVTSGYTQVTSTLLNLKNCVAEATSTPLLTSYGGVPRQASADIAVIGDAGVRTFLSSGSMSTGKPAGDGNIIHCEWDTTAGFSAQLFIPHDSGMMMQKRGMSYGTWGAWENILDDVNVKAYVVAQGTSGIWAYRKWSNGVAECWGTTAEKLVSTLSAWGSLYVCDDIVASHSYPFTFTDAPRVWAMYKRPSGGNDGWLISGSILGTASKSPSFGFTRATNNSINVVAEIYAVGKWK